MSGKRSDVPKWSELTASSIYQIFKDHVVPENKKALLPEENDKNLKNLAEACNQLQHRYVLGKGKRSDAQKIKREIEKSINFLAEILPDSHQNYADELNKIISERAAVSNIRRRQFRSPNELPSLEALDALIKALHQARSPAILESISLVPGCLAAPEDYDVFDVDLAILFRTWFEKINPFGCYRFIAEISRRIKGKKIDSENIGRTLKRRLERDDYYPSFAYQFLNDVYFRENLQDQDDIWWEPEQPLEAKKPRRNRMLSEVVLEEAERATPYDERDL